jgi:hypothetical protein
LRTNDQFLLLSPLLLFPPNPAVNEVYPGLFGQGQQTQFRQLILAAHSGTNPAANSDRFISGEFIESVGLSGSPHLTVSEYGIFVLTRDITLPSDAISLPDLVTAQP